MKKLFLVLTTIFIIISVCVKSEESRLSKNYFVFGANSDIEALIKTGMKIKNKDFSLISDIEMSSGPLLYSLGGGIGILYDFFKGERNNYFIGLKGNATKKAIHGKNLFGPKGIWIFSPSFLIGLEKNEKNRFTQFQINPFNKIEGHKTKANPSLSFNVGHYF